MPPHVHCTARPQIHFGFVSVFLPRGLPNSLVCGCLPRGGVFVPLLVLATLLWPAGLSDATTRARALQVVCIDRLDAQQPRCCCCLLLFCCLLLLLLLFGFCFKVGDRHYPVVESELKQAQSVRD